MKKISLAKSLLLSAASAAAVALLTPQSGEELRGKLKNKAKTLTEKGQEKKEELMEDVKASYSEAEKEMKLSEDGHPLPSPEETGLVSPDETSLDVNTTGDVSLSTREKGEEWLDNIGDEQDSLGEYPDASGSVPGGAFSDDTVSLPGGGPEGVDFLEGVSSSADPGGTPTSTLLNEANVTHTEQTEDPIFSRLNDDSVSSEKEDR